MLDTGLPPANLPGERSEWESKSDLIPNVKSLLFLITDGMVPFLYLLICPLLMIFINWAYDSRSSNLLLAADEELAP